MKRIIKTEQVHRVVSMILAIVLVMSLIPVSVFAASPSELTTDIGEKSFVVGTATEFTFTTTANEDAGTMVLGSFEFSDPSAIEKLEYKDSQSGNWYEFYGDFGPETGFPLTDATSEFRVTFKKAGVYTVDAYMKTVQDDSVLCTTSAEVTVEGKSSLITDIGSKTFVVDETTEFSFTTMANEDAGILVLGSFVFSDTEAVEKLEYKESQDGNWYEFSGDFGPATGFPLTDNATSYFRATFKKAGIYTLNAYMKEVNTGDTLCFTVATVTVKERSEISFTDESIEIKYSDANATNNTLNDSVDGAEYTYKSDDISIVTVNEYGILTPVSLGETTITVTRKENADYVAASASYTVKVVAGVQGELVWSTTVPESIKWNDPNGYSNTVSGGSGNGAVTYTSNNTEVAEVDPTTGALTLKKPGTVTITATKSGDTLYDDQTTSYTLVVIVSEQDAIVFEEAMPGAIYYGDEYTNVATGGSTGGDIKYESSDESIATVDENGKVTALKQGIVEITATLEGNDYYVDATPVTYTLTIYRASQKNLLVFEKGTEGQEITYGEDYTNAVSGGNTTPITYSSSDTKIATVDENGKVTALKAGSVTITASVPQTEQYEAQKLSYTLVIKRAEQTIEFENGSTNIPAITYGDSYCNKASAITEITYTSSDVSIAKVDAEGKLIIHKSGTVTITVTATETEQYKGATASYTITINKAEQTISFEKGEKVEVTFNDNENKFSNTASSNAIKGDTDDKKDIEILYSIASGKEFVVEDSFDSATGKFEIRGAGTILVKVSFTTNERYEAKEAFYTLVVKRDDQTIAFDKSEYTMINGDNTFMAPIASEKGEKYGTENIVYSIKKNDDDVVSAIDATTGALTFTNKIGEVTILATKNADDNYNETTAEYTLTIEDAELKGNVFHTLVGEKIDASSDWYTGNVSIKAAEGYLISYSKDVDNAEWQTELTDAVTEDTKGKNITFYVKNIATGQIYESQTVTIKKDATDPTAQINHEELSGWEKFLSIITLGMWEPAEMNFTITSEDVTSDIAKVEYYIAEGTTEVMDETTLGELRASIVWKEYKKDGIPVKKDKIFVVYAKVTDKAGQHIYATTNGIVFDRTAVPEENIVVDIITEDSKGFYDEDVELNIKMEDAAPSSGINSVTYKVFNKKVETQNGTLFTFNLDNPTYEQLVSSWDSATDNKNIIVDSELNNSDFVEVEITVVDNAGNKTIKRIPLKICINKPTIEVTYENDPIAIETYEGVTYYDASREAKIVITGRKSVFAASDDPKVVITETKGDTTKGTTYEVINWVTSESQGDPDAATHTYIIKFNGSANYDFSVDYTDIFGNNLTHESEKFAVDKDIPTVTVTIDESNTWTKLLETLTFGLWKNSEVTVKASATDATSPIKLLEYYKSNEDTILTDEALEKVTWTPFEEFKVSADEQFTVYLKVTDYAGHVNYICSDGYIVDMKGSNIAITPAQPNENDIYGDDFNVQIDVRDMEPYSGIKTVEYWVTCNGIETIRETLYSYEYVRDAGPNSNGGHLVIKELNENGKLETIVDKENYVPTKSDLKESFTKTITVDAQTNNSDEVVVFVKVVDNAGNEDIKETEPLKVDVVAPKIDVSFDMNNANVVDNRGYLKTNRVAKIVFTERTSSFDKEKATAGIVFSGVDSKEQPVPLERSVMINWDVTVEVEGNPDAATHTAYVYFMTDANYDFTVSYTDQAGHACEYADVEFADGTVAPRYFTVDKVNPEATIAVADRTWDKLLEILTFGLFKNETVTVSATAEDITSPVTIHYYKTNNVEILDKDALDAIAKLDWENYSEIKSSENDRFVVYLKVTDYAGNYIYINSDGYIVDTTEAEITLTPDATDLYHGQIPLYNKDVNILIDVKEKSDEAYAGINKVEYWVKCDGVETIRKTLYSYEYVRDDSPNCNGGHLVIKELNESGELETIFNKEDHVPAQSELKHSFTKAITIDAEENNSCDVVLYVGVTDNAGNYKEESVAVDIDITVPTISVRYDNDAPYKIVDDKGYFPKARTATVVITERTEHFNELKASESIKITALDVNNEVVIKDCSTLISAWNTEGIGDEATHTATIDFSADANYTFEISCTDLAENSNASVDIGGSATPYKFAVDKLEPTGTVTVGTLGTWDKLIEILTFGLWSKDTVDVTGTTSDKTTPIESVSYYKTANTTAKKAEELKDITTWSALEGISEFTGITVPADEQFVVYIRIVDYAGNVEYISTNGIIVDDTIPAIESVKPEITITPEPAHGIYNSNVTVAVSVVDPKSGDTNAYAGLKEIKYEIYNMGEKTQDGVLYSFVPQDAETGPIYGELKQTWSKADAIIVDKELNNSNDVKIVVYAVDNAGNENKGECDIKIDITAPEIDVTYDNNNGDTSFVESVYFKENRTAKIVVTERNFDPTMVNLLITNTDGYIPKITDWTITEGVGNGDATTHTAYVIFDKDGDYTFNISCTDTATNANTTVDYATSLAPEAFTVDKTSPIVRVVYDNNDVLNGNYYKAQRIATITVTEHNFETSRIKRSLKASDNGVDSTLPVVSDWSSKGDVHTATITYSEDSRYVFDFDYNDKAGNATADIAEQTFYVDKTNPVLKIENVADEFAYNDKGNIGFVMTATDTNMDVFTPVLTANIKNGDKFETKQLEIDSIEKNDDEWKFIVTNIENDGIYHITCTLVDKAGNAYSQVTLENADGKEYVETRAGQDTLVTFSVNRDGSTYEVDEETVKIVEQYYIQNLENDIVIVEINADPLKEYKVTRNGVELVEGEDYDVEKPVGSGEWMKYIYKIKKEKFVDEGEYKIDVYSKDKADNDAFSDVKDATIEFVVDRTAPTVPVSGLANDGRYQTEEQVVTLQPSDPGGSLKSLIVRKVDENGEPLGADLVNLSGEELVTKLETNDGKITFTIKEGLYQNIQIICTDCAIGDSEATNTYDVTYKNISVSSSEIMIFWANKPLRWGTIGGVSAVAVALTIFIIYKKRKEEK